MNIFMRYGGVQFYKKEIKPLVLKNKNEQGMIYSTCDKFPMSLTKMELAKLPHPNLF